MKTGRSACSPARAPSSARARESWSRLPRVRPRPSRRTFSVRVPQSGPRSSIENIGKATKTAEELGFDAVWVHDHVVWSSEMHRHHISSGAAEALTDTQEANFFEATTILSYLAAETKKITLGVACLVMPCRNPIYAAKQYSTLDWLANGRLLVGVGLA